jgi:hypothetical protein
MTDEPSLRGSVQENQTVESPQTTSEPTEPSSESAHGTELDMYKEIYDKLVQSRLPVTNEAEERVSSGVSLDNDEVGTIAVEKIVSDAVEGIASHLDSHIDTLADFLQNTSKALRIVAEKTRESDTSAVENILSGFNVIFGEVGKLAKAVLDTAEATPAAGPVELDLQQIHETASDKGKSNEHMIPEPKQNELSAFVEAVSDVVQMPLPVLASSPRPIVRVATQPAQQVKLSPLHHRGTELTARLPASQLDKLYHIPSKSFIDNQPQEVSAEKDSMYATFERGGFNPDSDRTWKYMPLPDDEQMSKTKKKVGFALPSGTIRPRETAKSSSESFPRSILDLETSDPDFSARFPPLMTVRRSKTMESLRQRSKSPDNRMRSRQDALKRFPSLVQLERRKAINECLQDRSDEHPGKSTMLEKQPGSHTHRAWFDDVGAKTVKPVKNEITRQSDEVEEVIAAVGRDIAEASNEVRRLPGAWPEVQIDSKTPLPTSNESSGAFFNRMTGQSVIPERRQPTPFPDPLIARWPSSGYVEGRATHKLKQVERAQSMVSFNPSATLTTPFDPLMPSAIVCDPVETGTKSKAQPFLEPTDAEIGVGSEAYLNGKNNGHGLLSSNGARDPYIIPRRDDHQQSTPSKLDGVRRSATEKMPHRRPYSHRYSGAGRLPWENFEDHTFDLRTGSFVQRQERARRAADRLTPQSSVANDADTRQWNRPEYSNRRHASIPAARQNPAHPIKLPSDLHQRVNDYRAGVKHRASMPTVGIARQSQINDCARQLKYMGFGNEDEHEASRLPVYAAATGGDIFEAVQMIEEDRKAGRSLEGKRQMMGPENGPGGWL